jgi:DNA-binding PadR family transcriptional regulator
MIDLLALHCLNSLCDDYENITTILSDLRQATHGDIKAEDVEGILSDLVADELVSAYDFDAANSQYVPSDGTSAGLKDKWFFITEKGRMRLNHEWVD